MKAKPNLNGNAPVDFTKAGEALLEAAHELTTTLSGVRHLIHGRNYQTYAWSEVAQDHLEDDTCTFMDHMIAVEALRDYAYEVLSAAAINTNEEN
tara:strand:- start:320 stop:604 length:285 start_codon:yes stop_codon:yes gene_type:complete